MEIGPVNPVDKFLQLLRGLLEFGKQILRILIRLIALLDLHHRFEPVLYLHDSFLQVRSDA